MAHNHTVYDTDLHFTIDPESRVITNPSEKVRLMQYDHNSERITFEIPRYIDGHDMSQCTKIKVHYINISTSGTETSSDVYEVDDAHISPDSEDTVIFSWLIAIGATRLEGIVDFVIRFTCLDGNNIVYAFGTDICSEISVSRGIDNGEEVIVNYSDIIELWKREVMRDLESAITEAKNDLEDTIEDVLYGTQGDNKILRSYGGKWYPVYPSLFAPQDSWYKGKTAKNDIQTISIVDSYTPTGKEAESWNGDVDNMGLIKCYVNTEKSYEKVFVNWSGYQSLVYPLIKRSDISVGMNSLGMFNYYSNDYQYFYDPENMCSFTFLKFDSESIQFEYSNPGGGGILGRFQGSDVILTLDEVRSGVWEIFYHTIDGNGNIIEEGNYHELFLRESSSGGTMISYLETCITSSPPNGYTVKEEYSKSDTTLTIVGNGYGKLSCHMDSSYMFYNFKGLVQIDGADLLDTSAATTMKTMFGNDNALYTVDVSTWDTSNVTNMNAMFGNCYVLESADVYTWDTSNVTDMGAMFQNCRGIRLLDVSNWNTSKNTTFRNTFKGCTGLMSLDVSNFDTSNVTTLYATFSTCSALTTIDVSKWNTSKVTDMTSTFAWCYELITVDVSNWNTSNVTTMRAMFNLDYNLTTLDVSKWNVSNVIDMSQMFCTSSVQNAADGKLTALDVSKWNTASLEDADSMFYGNGELTSLDLRGWDISKVKTMSHMFCDCRKLAEIKLDGLVASSCISFDGMFNDCVALVTIDLTGFVTAAAQEFSQMFEGCTSLKTIIGLDTFVTTGARTYEEMFRACESLEGLDLRAFETENNLIPGIHYGRDGETYTCMKDMFAGMLRLREVIFPDAEAGEHGFFFYDNAVLPIPSTAYLPGATGFWISERYPDISLEPSSVHHNNPTVEVQGRFFAEVV